MSDVIRSLDEPINRENRIIQYMADHAKTHEEWEPGDKTIVMYYGATGAGIGVYGYENNATSDGEAMADMLTSLVAMFEANGLVLSLIPIKEKGQG